MWRSRSTHRRAESEYLNEALLRLVCDEALRQEALATLHAAAAHEPLIAEAIVTPQSPPHHAEGPVVEDHLRIMLSALYGIVQGKLHLTDIEEFRVMKGFDGEIEELEETLKENVALFEVFTLCHDAAKWAAVSFSSPRGSRGADMGFNTEPLAFWDDIGISERAKWRERYQALFSRFAADHPTLRPEELEARFFDAFQIRVHYNGHDRLIHTPAYRGLLARHCAAHGLSDRDEALLADLIAHHLEPIFDFADANPSRIGRFIRFAEERGWDADDYIDLLQACVFLDDVCGSMDADSGAHWSAASLQNFLRAEHNFAPWRRAEKEEARVAEKARERQRLFRESGLDGVALLDLFRMEPGPKFGSLLRAIHGAIVGENEMPALPARLREEIARRTDRYYELAFPRGL